MVRGFKTLRSMEEGGGPLPLLSSLSEGQLEQNFVVCNYVTNWIKNHNKIDDINTGPL